MNGFIEVQECEDPIDKIIAFEVGKFSKCRTLEVLRFVRIAARATQRTFASYLDRKCRITAT